MNNPALYHNFNEFTRASATQCLDEYAPNLRWNNTGDKIIDMGCGDGGVTAIIKRYIPIKWNKFVASDINPNMLDFAKKYLNDQSITFTILDAEGSVAADLRNEFHHVFAFSLFHWLRNQEKAFRNVYDLLTEGGECLLTIFGYFPAYHVYDILSRNEKWSSWLKENKFISPYYFMEQPEQYIKKMMQNIGFTNIDIKTKKQTYIFKNGAELRHLLRSVDAYNMPDDVFEEFLLDFVAVGKDIGLFKKNMNVDLVDSLDEIIYEYNLLVVLAQKPT